MDREPKASGRRVPEVLVLGAFPYPFGTASSNFIRGHAKALLGTGHSVGVLAEQVGGRPEDRNGDQRYQYRGVDYWGVERCPKQRFPERVLRNIFAWRTGSLKWIRDHGKLSGVKAVFYYPGVNGTVPLLTRLRTLCSRRKVKLYVYVVEWHKLGGFGLSPFSWKAIDGELQRRLLKQFADGVICISSYLRDYYSARGCKTALIPPLLDLSDPAWLCGDGNCEKQIQGTRVLFSGSPMRERHDLILRGAIEARHRGANITLEYLGPSRSDIVRLPGVGEKLISDLGDSVHFHGQQPLASALKIAASATFGLCVRDQAKWSKAGFPSKVPEFLALGVPMICNLSSDLADYLSDRRNALTISDLSVEEMARVFLRASRINKICYGNMRKLARDSASSFASEKFVETYSELLAGRTGNVRT